MENHDRRARADFRHAAGFNQLAGNEVRQLAGVGEALTRGAADATITNTKVRPIRTSVFHAGGRVVDVHFHSDDAVDERS